MRKNYLYTILILLAAITLVTLAYHFIKPKPIISNSWSVVFKKLGTLSSPRLADLNQDGILDAVMGAGSVEFHPSDSAIIAINGATGKMLWVAGARDQIFGSPIFKDINDDGIPEIFIGGRSAEMKAINGKNGKIIWEYYNFAVNLSRSDSGAYNFFSAQFIPDQDHDGFEDLVVAAGGYVKALPDNPDRPAGKLLVISSATGKLLASAEMPDGKEIYMSVVIVDFKGDNSLSVIFGTGGETVGGGLYKAFLSDLLKNDLSRARLLESGYEKGFIAPPVLADITGDGIPEIIANSVNGRMIAIDGDSEKVLWRVSLPGTEAYCSISAGYYTGDNVPDFFTNFGIGIWPDLKKSVQIMVNGKSGQIEFRDSLGTFQESTPLTFDYDQDGFEDALFSINYQHTSAITNQLMVIDFHNDTIYTAGPRNYGANVASTPWLGDMDNDQFLDIVYCNEINPFDLFSIEYKEGLKVSRLKTQIRMKETPTGGAYMGSSYDGIFRGKRKTAVR
ncbi:MAG: hypothetical protein ABIR06_21170 [Cyclobacteriaceae bacterium]